MFAVLLNLVHIYKVITNDVSDSYQ